MARASPSGRSARWSEVAACSSKRTTRRPPVRRSPRPSSSGSRTQKSVAALSLPCSPCSASNPAFPPTSYSEPGESSSSGSRNRAQWRWYSKTSTTPTRASSTSSSTCSSGARACLSTSSRWGARSCSTSARTGVRRSATSPRSTSTLCPRRICASCLSGSCRDCPRKRRSRSSIAPMASRSMQSKPCACWLPTVGSRKRQAFTYQSAIWPPWLCPKR